MGLHRFAIGRDRVQGVLLGFAGFEERDPAWCNQPSSGIGSTFSYVTNNFSCKGSMGGQQRIRRRAERCVGGVDGTATELMTSAQAHVFYQRFGIARFPLVTV